MIEIRDLSKSFGKLDVLRQVSISFQPGQCVSLIGPNGSGKTTLIKCILGLVLPDKGDILFESQSLLRQHLHRSQFGYMPQAANYPGHMNIGQVVEMAFHALQFLGRVLAQGRGDFNAVSRDLELHDLPPTIGGAVTRPDGPPRTVWPRR